MKSKTVLVTGGAGFIGSHVVDRLLEQKLRVVVVDDFNDYYSPVQKKNNLEKAASNKGFELIKGDIRGTGLIEGIFSKYEIGSVIHLAARAGVRQSLIDPKLYWDTNVMGTLNILETMRKYKVNKLIFASSSSVYGNRDKGPFKETDSTDYPVSPYGASKKAMEVLCSTYASLYGIDTVGLRFFTVYGPRNRPDMACYLFTDAVSRGKALTQYGCGNSGRDYTYIDDIVAGILACWSGRFGFEIFNLGNSSPVLLSDVIKTVETVVGKKSKINKLNFQQGDVVWTYADINKARRLLKWKPRINFNQGMKCLYEWYRQIPK